MNTVFGISKNRRGKTLLLIAKSLYLDTAVYFVISLSLFDLFINRLIYLLAFNYFQLETYNINISTSFHCPIFMFSMSLKSDEFVDDGRCSMRYNKFLLNSFQTIWIWRRGIMHSYIGAARTQKTYLLINSIYQYTQFSCWIM